MSDLAATEETSQQDAGPASPDEAQPAPRDATEAGAHEAEDQPLEDEAADPPVESPEPGGESPQPEAVDQQPPVADPEPGPETVVPAAETAQPAAETALPAAERAQRAAETAERAAEEDRPPDVRRPRAATPRRWDRRHLLDVDELTFDDLEAVMATADSMRTPEGGLVRDPILRDRQVTLLFYEASTRTRVSFEVAAKRLGADVVNVSVAASSVAKGESLIDTLRTLAATGSDVIVLRHARSGAPYLAAQHFHGRVVNAGDGSHAHPTQALADIYTLRARLGGGDLRALRGRKVVILGDILHSRVARSNVWSLTRAGVDVWLCGPAPLIVGFGEWARAIRADGRVTATADMDAALRDADAVMALRIQRERQDGGLLTTIGEYVTRYGLTRERLALARPGALVLHPGPMNEGVEIAPDVATGETSVITEQVASGVPIRMAVLALIAGNDAGAPR